MLFRSEIGNRNYINTLALGGGLLWALGLFSKHDSAPFTLLEEEAYVESIELGAAAAACLLTCVLYFKKFAGIGELYYMEQVQNTDYLLSGTFSGLSSTVSCEF